MKILRSFGFIAPVLLMFFCSCSNSSQQNSNLPANASPAVNMSPAETSSLNQPASNTTSPISAPTLLNATRPPTAPTPWTMTTSNSAPAAVAPADKQSDLTMARYDKLKIGMDYSEVAKILGREGIEVMKSETDGVKKITYKWEGEKNVYVVLTFENDKLTYKSQANLK